MNTTIAELRRLEAEATPGPWRVIIDDDGNPLSGRPGVFASDELDCGIIHWDGFVQEYWRSAHGDKEIEANAALIVAMRNALPELLKALEWQPIETAPKGKLIDIWISHRDGSGIRWCDCYYDRICDEWRTSRPSGRLLTIKARHVTHWRPLPLPPHGGVDEPIS